MEVEKKTHVPPKHAATRSNVKWQSTRQSPRDRVQLEIAEGCVLLFQRFEDVCPIRCGGGVVVPREPRFPPAVQANIIFRRQGAAEFVLLQF